jgi:hypothetical protein
VSKLDLTKNECEALLRTVEQAVNDSQFPLSRGTEALREVCEKLLRIAGKPPPSWRRRQR